MSAVNEFRKLIANEPVGEGLDISPWPGATRRSYHLLEINTKKKSTVKSTVLYIKESNSSPGFWGLTKNQLDQLDKAQVRWFAVLLLKSNNTGYVLSSNEVKNRLQDGTFELSKDGDHKVNERTDLNPNMTFRRIQDLLARVL
jgi:hypothetical protein